MIRIGRAIKLLFTVLLISSSWVIVIVCFDHLIQFTKMPKIFSEPQKSAISEEVVLKTIKELKTSKQDITDNSIEAVMARITPVLPLTKDKISEIFDTPQEIDVKDLKKQYSSALWTAGCPNEPPSIVARPSCTRPRNKILFVKVHKCGSSTIAAMLLRYAVKKNLKVALPAYGTPRRFAHIGYPKVYRPHYVHMYEGNGKYDMIANHFVYDRCIVQRDFPIKDVVYTTILREPWKQFVSAFNFFEYREFRYPHLKPPFLKNILENPTIYAREIPLKIMPNFDAKKSLFKNMMSTDLGFTNDQAFNQSAIDLFIKRIDKDFDLVMIAEYYAESVVLLKRLMCWDFKDIFYLKMNSMTMSLMRDEPITDTMRKQHEELDNVDYQLYKHFKDKLIKKIEESGPDFKEEVHVFATGLKTIERFCSFGGSRELKLEKNKFMKETTINRMDCMTLRKKPYETAYDMRQEDLKKKGLLVPVTKGNSARSRSTGQLPAKMPYVPLLPGIANIPQSSSDNFKQVPVTNNKLATSKQKLLYLPIHHCRDNTTSSMILRYGKRNQLSIALPKYDNKNFGYPLPYHTSYVHNYKTPGDIDLISGYFVHSGNVRKDFPKPKVFYATMIREPWTHFVSLVNDPVFRKMLPGDLKFPELTNILRSPEKYAVAVKLPSNNPKQNAEKNIFKNMMATDLGFDNKQSSNPQYVDSFVKTINEDFDLVMIQQYFHESLVLLKRKMNWELRDIFYVDLDSSESQHTKEVVTEDMLLKHRELAHVDYELYKFFRKKFEVETNALGLDFRSEVSVFTVAQRKIQLFCDYKIMKHSNLKFEKNNYMPETTIKREDCWELHKVPDLIIAELKSSSFKT